MPPKRPAIPTQAHPARDASVGSPNGTKSSDLETHSAKMRPSAETNRKFDQIRAPPDQAFSNATKNAALSNNRGWHLPDAKSEKFVPLGGLDPSFARKRKQSAAPKPQKRLFAPTPGSTWHPEKARARAAMTEADIRAPLLLPFKATQPAKKQCRHCQRPRCRKAPWLYRHRSRWCRSRNRPQQVCPS